MSAMTLGSSVLDSASRYVRHAWEHRVHKDRFIVAGKTRFESLCQDDIMEVRYYPPQDTRAFALEDEQVVPVQTRHRVPVLLVPPLGVYGWIYDLMAERSWVRFLNAQGFDVYMVDWGAPERHHASELTLENYVNHWMATAVTAVQQHSGQQDISLIGYCMGGLLCLLYAGAHDQGHVRNLVTIASPLDFHASHFYGKLMQLASSGSRKIGYRHASRLRKSLAPERFHVPGDLLSTLFKLTNPLSGVASYFELVRNLSDRDYVKAHLTKHEWFGNMVDFPGATMQRLVFDFCIGNALAGGRVKLGAHTADLTSIRSNYLAFAGKTDAMVSIRAARKGMELLASADKTFKVVPGGHAGVFAGGNARQHSWALTAQWLAQRS